MIFLDACKKKPTPHTPIWMMRQAGRYLSEYMRVREQAGSFMQLCKNPKLASEVTLQPIDILDVDAAIIFSDILVIPHEMGLEVEFLKGEGPVFKDTIRSRSDLAKLKSGAHKRLGYMYETLSLTREQLDDQKALIGFCGAPWTLATYMIEGQGSKTYAASKKLLYSDPQTLHILLGRLRDELIEYLKLQIKAGADAVMVFDSWAGALEESAFFEFSWRYMREVGEAVKKAYPDTPVMLFPKGVGGFLHGIEGEFDVFGVDWSTPMEHAKALLGERYVLQGNLEPCRLYDRAKMEEGVDRIVAAMGAKEGHIFNLGHGMLPDLPRENAIALVQMVKEKTRR